MENIQKDIGKRIKNYRLKRNMTQEELAEKANLHVTFIAHIESGRKIASVRSLEKISSALKIPLYMLFTDTEQPIPKIYDEPLSKLISMVKDKTDYDKKLLLSIASSIFKKKKK